MSWLSSLFFSKFKTFFILGSSATGAGVIGLPVYIAGNRYEQHLFREFNPVPENYSYEITKDELVKTSTEEEAKLTDNQSKFTNFPEVKVSNAQLIRGTKAYNDGNYVLYFGSEACPNCNNFLYSESESPKTWIGTDQKNLYRNGIFYETYSLVRNHEKKSNSKLKGLKFIFFSDEVPSMENRNNDDLATIPWTTWDKTLVSQGRIRGDYRRYDQSALQFRRLQSLLFYYFGEKAQGIPAVIIYKDGIPFVFGRDKIEEIEEDKRKTGEQVKSIQDATADDADSKAVIFRYDLFKHLKWIFDSEWIWRSH